MAKRTLAVLFMFLLLLVGTLPMAAQDFDASQLTSNPLVTSGPTGPVSYDYNTHTLTISNTTDVSQPMMMCSQYNQYGQCQGQMVTYYHTATGAVTIHNLTKGTWASNYDQKTGALMNANASIAADIGDQIDYTSTQTVYCPAVGATVASMGFASGGGAADPLHFYLEIAFTMAANTGGSPTNCKVLNGQTFCTFNASPWCTPSTSPPDHNIKGVQWAVSDGQGFWLTVALCGSPTGGQPWTCSPGIAFGEGLTQPLYSCTHNP